MEEDIRRLHERTASTRYQFLQAELQTCFTALDLAKYELSVGNTSLAEREIAHVEKGIRAIQRFLPEVSGEQRTELEAKLADLQEMLSRLKAPSSGEGL
jgi:chromosome segregation ATPase